MKRVIKDSVIFLLFGAVYFLLETIWKGHPTHWSMFILGGLCGLAVGKINEYLPWEMSYWIQCVIGTITITLLEGCAGLVLNVWLHLDIWDYSHMFGTFFYGQCCVPFCCLWFLLAGAGIIIDDFLRYKLFGERYPLYNFSL